MNQSHWLNPCEAFRSQLPDLFDCSMDLYSHPHLQHCTLCRALIVDLARIADSAARQNRRSDQRSMP
jgi:hypothetical protein